MTHLLEIVDTPQPTEPKSLDWPKIILATVLGFGLLVGAAYAGYWYGTQQAQQVEEPLLVSQPTPTPVTTPTPTTVTKQPLGPLFEPVENSSIIFAKEGKVFLLAGLNNQPTEVAEGNHPSFSPNRSKVAYVKVDRDNNIHVYDVKNGQTEILSTDEWRLRGVSWSPDGKYLITDSGTDVVGGGGVYEYPTGGKIASFATYGKIGWIGDEGFVFVEPQEVSPSRPYGGGQGSGLSKVTLPNGNVQLLAQATALEDFDLIKVESGTIYFSKTTVKSNDDWGFSGRKETSYWQMSSGGGGKIEIVEPETLEKDVLNGLPAKFSGYYISSSPVLHPDIASWVTFGIHKEGSIFDDPVCIMDLNNPDNSFMQVATGAYPSW